MCDDGDNLPYDGCDADCNVETGFTCTSAVGGISTCTEACGDGVNLGS